MAATAADTNAASEFGSTDRQPRTGGPSHSLTIPITLMTRAYLAS
ncbi:MAG: hypothetical protein JWP25_2158 [Bradyrhizobium sp.]|nr:hypothetical protein [Bradyrhizobium sp.]